MAITDFKAETNGLILDENQLPAILGGGGEFPDPPPPEGP